ncbi:hypothetical protein [Ruegeria sp. MALMAid1280]|uniref:hypothetical protein n=1 Tax=Ruegeria sp. MALMAid1280 TaxID=3411634 RepID=UPI003B9EECCE
MKRLKLQWQSIRSGIASEHPLEVGKALTKVFLTIVVFLALLPQHTEAGGWNLRLFALLVSPANEIGDTFAGIAGVLAFLWIIITVWLQSQELAAQREELRLTRLEMGEQRKATQDMARAMSAQAEASETVQKQRSQNAAKDLLDQLLENFVIHCHEGSFETWRYHRVSEDKKNRHYWSQKCVAPR